MSRSIIERRSDGNANKVVGMQMAEVATLIGNPGRAAMLATMLDGRAHTATELATAASVTASTASGHLAKLLQGRLVGVAAQGRHRYYRLASQDVARMLEGIMVVTADPVPRARATPRVPVALRDARTCYDHLAGRLGVAIADTLVEAGAVNLAEGRGEISARGSELLAALGIEVDAARDFCRRVTFRPCLDWSERRPHIAGTLGTALLARLLGLGWIERVDGSRAVRVTRTGAPELSRRFRYE